MVNKKKRLGLNKIKKFLLKFKWLILIFFIHFLLVNHFFPVVEVFNNKPIVTDDYPYHLYRANFSKELILQGSVAGFNFFFTGGRGGILMNWDLFFVLLSVTFFFVPIVTIFKIYIYLLFLMVPILTYATARNFNFDKQISLLATLLSTIVWNFHNYIHIYMWGGIYSHISGGIVAIFSISLLYRFTVRNRKRDLTAGLVFSVISVLMHPLVILVLILPYIVFLPRLIKKHILSKTTIFAVFFVGLVFLTLFWRTFLYFGRNVSPNFATSLGLISIVYELLHRPIQGVIFILGFYGIFLFKSKKIKYQLFLYTAIYYFVVGYFGSYAPLLESYKTYRLIVPLCFLLVYPASFLVFRYFMFLKTREHKHLFKIGSLLLTLLVLGLYFGLNFHQYYVVDERYKEIDGGVRGMFGVNTNNERYENTVPLDRRLKFKLTTNIPKDTEKLISWIRKNTNNQARILIEDSGCDSKHQYGGHIVSLFPELTGRQFFNRPGTYVDEKEHIKVASFWNKKILNKNLDKYNEEALFELFNDYNLKWVIAFSDSSIKKFNSYPSLLKKIDKVGKFTIYETNITPSFFIEGNGTIELGFSSIKVFNASKGKIILKYPYSIMCYSEPNLEIGSTGKFNTFTGFIIIENNSYDNFKIKCMKKII